MKPVIDIRSNLSGSFYHNETAKMSDKAPTHELFIFFSVFLSRKHQFAMQINESDSYKKVSKYFF